MERENSFNWGSLLIGILFIIAALFVFQDPTVALVSIAWFIGIVAIIDGAYLIFFRSKIKSLVGYGSTALMVVGILDILFGILILFNIGGSMIALPVLFAIWFIADSVVGLITAGISKAVSNGYYWFTIIINILGIIVGVMLLTNIAASALTLAYLVGFYLVWFGIIRIVDAFLGY